MTINVDFTDSELTVILISLDYALNNIRKDGGDKEVEDKVTAIITKLESVLPSNL